MRNITLLLFVFILISNTIFSQSYIGTITKQVNFRNEPSKTGELLKILKPIIKFHSSEMLYIYLYEPKEALSLSIFYLLCIRE